MTKTIIVFVAGVLAGLLLARFLLPLAPALPVAPPLEPDRTIAPQPRAAVSKPPPTALMLLREAQYQQVFAQASVAELLTVLPSLADEQQVEVLRQAITYYGDQWPLLAALVQRYSSAGRHEAAFQLLPEAGLAAVSPLEQQRFSELLDQVMDRYEQDLVAGERYEVLDEVLETVTLTFPEEASYFLKLGLLRIRLGNYDMAMAPLSQLENHPLLGPQARELMAQTVVDEQGDSESLAIRYSNNQFVVDALIDDRHPVSLLIDTGAAMTVLDRSVLSDLGYSLRGQRMARFATAGGVVDAPVLSVRRLALGNAQMGPLAVGAMPLALPQGVAGLLGMNFLRHYEFRIDQQRGMLHLQPK